LPSATPFLIPIKNRTAEGGKSVSIRQIRVIRAAIHVALAHPRAAQNTQQ